MPLLIDWLTRRITVPQTYLEFVSGTLYRLNTVQFFNDLKSLETTEEGILHDDIQSHNASFTVVGTTFVDKVEIINGYSVEFENLAYSVILEGSNNNIWDIQAGVLVQNLVQVIPTNSAGNTVTTVNTGSGVTPQDITDIANAVDNTLQDDFSSISTSVDTNAIALAVETQLADEFASINATVDLTPVTDAIAALNDFDPANDTVTTVTTVTNSTPVDNTAIALEVEAVLTDNFASLDMSIGNVPAATEVELNHRFNTLDANIASINTDTSVSIPNQITSLYNFNPTLDTVARVTLVDTTTSNVDMRGTDNAITSPSTITADIDASSSKLAAIETNTINITTSITNAVTPVIDAIKLVTDKFRFTKPNEVDVNIKSQNDATLLGKGTSADKWRGE